MATPTYTPLANVTLGSSASSVTFSSISQAYRDLIIVFTGGDSSGAETGQIRINADTGGNYSGVRMKGDGSSTASYSWSNVTGLYYGIIDGTTGNSIIQIMDYSATDKHKTVLTRTNVVAQETSANAWRWANTAAITSISFSTYSTYNYLAGSTFALYGVVA